LFLYERTTGAGQDEMFFRPLIPIYGRYKNAERGYSYHHIVYPFYWNHGTNHWRKWTFLYLFTGDSKYHSDTKDDDDLMLGSLFFWGRGETEKERYFSFFPFGGR